jgi:FkbM family methyltransferase
LLFKKICKQQQLKSLNLYVSLQKRSIDYVTISGGDAVKKILILLSVAIILSLSMQFVILARYRDLKAAIVGSDHRDLKTTIVESDLRDLKAAIVDPNGVGMVNLMMKNANVPKKYENIIYQIEENSICIDCGANVGLISDIFLKLGAKCYAFEPSKECVNILNQKFSRNDKFKLIEAAVSNENGEANFLTTSPFDLGGNIVNATPESFANHTPNTYRVKTVRLSDFIKNLLKTNDEIYLLKLDIEGAEFDVLEDIINTGVYKHIKFIVCETHERFNKELREKFEHLKQVISEKRITNIYLDWI